MSCGCSMGGILVKEMLVKSMQPGAPALHAQLRRQTRGLAFYATPHHGSWLADVGWNLRFLGASPAASVVHLKRGPQQEVLLRPMSWRDSSPSQTLQSEWKCLEDSNVFALKVHNSSPWGSRV